MRSMKALIVAAASVVLLSAIPNVQAQNPPARNRSATAPAQGARQGGGQRQGLQNLQAIVEKLNLTDDQKAQLKPIMEDMRKSMQDLRNTAQGPERAQKMREIMTQTREKLSKVLTDEQQTKLRELMQQQRAGGPTTQPANPIDRLASIVQGLDLSDDQKAKVKEIVDGYRAEFEGIRKDNAGDRQAMMQQARPLFQEMREKLTAILTPEQTQKFQEQMQNLRLAGGDGQGGAGAGARGNRAKQAPANQ